MEEWQCTVSVVGIVYFTGLKPDESFLLIVQQFYRYRAPPQYLVDFVISQRV